MTSTVDPSKPAAGQARGIIPTSQVIVVRERDLDCDLATAIQRIRANHETAGSRILVVGPDEPSQPAGADALPAPRAPTTLSQVARRGEESALVDLGTRLTPLAACLGRYLEEMRAVLAASEGSGAGEARRELSAILDWTEALGTELSAQVESAQRGFRLVDTRELFADMAGQIEALLPGVRVAVAVDSVPPCLGRPTELAEAFFLAMALVGHRIGGAGAIAVEFEAGDDGILTHRVFGSGEPREVAATDSVARFRRLVHDHHGGRIRHDELGPGGTGLAILLRTA